MACDVVTIRLSVSICIVYFGKKSGETFKDPHKSLISLQSYTTQISNECFPCSMRKCYDLVKKKCKTKVQAFLWFDLEG